jgi:hypothetical protein
LPAADSELVVYADDADNSIGRWRTALIIIRRGRQTIEHVERTRKAVTDYIGTSDRRLGLLHVYEPGAELPDRECRRLTANLVAQLGPHIACAATVFEGESLRFAMMRLAVRSLAALSGTTARRFIGADVADAAQWMGTAMASGGAEPVAPEELLRIVTDRRGGRVASSALSQPV